jgi:iron complex outermembrane receptor protein
MKAGKWGRCAGPALLASIAVTAVPDSGHAADASAAARPAAVETLIVTAEKRPEPLQETPISITAFSARDLQIRNVENLSNIASYTPNLVFEAGAGDTGSSNTAQIFIRGIGQSDFLFTTDPGVGLYLDGVYLPTSVGSLMDLNDIQQIEVLKGPQGTLFGQNTIGGAINITTRPPSATFGGQAAVELGNYSTRNFQGEVNIPLSNHLLSSLSFSSRNEDGWVKRPADHSMEGDIDSQVVRGQLLWSPSNAFDLRLIADYTRKREHAIPEFELGVDGGVALLGLWNALVGGPAGTPYNADAISTDPTIDRGTGPNYSNLNVGGVAATATWRLDDTTTLKSITSYRRQTAGFGIDTDHSAANYIFQTVADTQDQVSQELQLTGSMFGGRLSYATGLTYYGLTGEDRYHLSIAPGLYPIVGIDIDELIYTHLDSKSYSAYGHLNYDLTDQLSISAGLRYTDVDKSLDENLHLLASKATKFDVHPSDSWDAFTPQFGVQYQVTPDAMVYASASRGFKAGGFNGRSSTGFIASTPFDPEYVWTYEAGAKTAWFEHRLVLNGAAFYTDYTDLQLLTVLPDPSSGGAVAAVVQNAGRARIQGFELEAKAVPVENLGLDLGVGYLDGRYTHLSSNVSGVTLDSTLPKTPRWTLTAGGDYKVSLGEKGSVTARIDYSYRSTVQEVANNSPLLVQRGFGLLSANLRYAPNDDNWDVALYGSNLTDERYITNGLDAASSLGIAGVSYGRPREYGVRLGYRF